MASRAEILITAQDRTNSAFKSVERSFLGLRTASLGLTTAIGAIGSAFGLREVSQMAESFTNIQARLRLATRSAEEFAEANASIQRIAASSKSPLESTATLYTRISQSLLDVGGTQTQVANTTQALALALRLSGATAQESASAMLQFSQAIGSGVLRGEEFNAINEAAPRVMKALADSMGVPIGQLREMAKEGQITRDVLVEALGSQLPQLIEEAATLPDTIGTSFTELKNQLVLTIGELDRVTGASGKAASFISTAGSAALKTIVLFGANAVFVFRDVAREIGGVGERLAALATGDFQGFDQIGQRIKRETSIARRELQELQDKIVGTNQATPAPINTGSKERVQELLKEAGAASQAEAARKKLEATIKAAANADNSAIQSLRSRLLTTRELSEVEQTGEEIRAGRYKDLSVSAKQQLLILAAQVDSQKALNQAEEDQAAIQKRNTEEGIARFKSLQEAGARVYESTRTDAERYGDEIGHLNDLLNQGAITQETYNRAVSAAQDEYQKAADKAKDASAEMSQFSLQAARNMQTHFANFLFDPFDKGIKGMLSGFLDVIRRMAAEAAAAQIFTSLFGSSKGGDKGLLGDVFSSAISSMFGGSSVKGFAGGGMHSGGLRLVGEQGPELEATGPSRIFNANETRSMLGGGGDNITLNLTIQTGVQQTVRAEVMSMVPAIKKEVIAGVANAKARGGRMGNSL